MTRISAVAQFAFSALIGLYLGAGHGASYTAATVAVAAGATVAARRSTRTLEVEFSANRAESIERVAVPGVVEDDFNRHVDGNIAGFTLDDVRHYAGTLV